MLNNDLFIGRESSVAIISTLSYWVLARSERPLSWKALHVYKHFIEVLCSMASLEGMLYSFVDSD